MHKQLSNPLLYLWEIRRFLICWLSPFIFLPLLLIPMQEAKCAYVVLLMIVYWFTEVIPMAITALIPIVFFPLFEIVKSDEIAKSYSNGTVMVFLGSLIASSAVSKSNLHERIALKVILLTGTSPKRLLMGFMATTGFLSMWISNLASVALMIPIVNAALDQLTHGTIATHNDDQSSVFVTMTDEKSLSSRTNSISIVRNRGTSSKTNIGLSKKESRKLRKGILLGICYAANIGGTGTLTGTSTNLVLNGFLKEDAISFADWSFFNVPGLVLLIFLTWVFISTFFITIDSKRQGLDKNEKQIYEMLRCKYEKLGKLTFHEFAVMVLFCLLLLLWFLRAPDFMNGWSTYLVNDKSFIKDSMPTMLVVLLFFLIPANPKNLKTSPMLLDWKTVHEKTSWSVILLLGGGFAMAKGCERSGLSAWLGNSLKVLEDLPQTIIVMFMCSIALILTELISNTASITILLPVIHQMALSINMNPLSIMLPVTVGCSYAFMLPFASGTNAIIFEVGKMKNKDMLFPGFFMKIMCITVLLIITNTWGPVIFDMSPPMHINIDLTEQVFSNVTTL